MASCASGDLYERKNGNWEEIANLRSPYGDDRIYLRALGENIVACGQNIGLHQLAGTELSTNDLGLEDFEVRAIQGESTDGFIRLGQNDGTISRFVCSKP